MAPVVPELWLPYASWDLTAVDLADPKTGVILGRLELLGLEPDAVPSGLTVLAGKLGFGCNEPGKCVA